MEKNKTGKYLKYAVGEIVLVVFGILIALSINNWNQKRLDKQQATGYLKNLVEDLKSDTIQYNLNIKTYETQIANNSTPLLNDDYKILEVDSIVELINSYFEVNKISRQTFEKIKNAGLIELLGTEEINNTVNDYYNKEVAHYAGFLEWDKKYTERDVEFFFHNPNYESITARRNYNVKLLPFKDSLAKRKADLIKLIESTQGRNSLRNAIERNEYGINRVNITKSAAKNLLELIDKELNKSK
jgi:Family of unknown function (DUF6090)